MIIDCHCHAGEGDGFTGPWDTAAPLGPPPRARARGRHRTTVLFSAFHSDYARQPGGGAHRRVPARTACIGFAFVHAARDRGRIRALVRDAVERYGFCGIKVHRYDARHHARGLRGRRARFASAGALRRDGRGRRPSSCWRRSIPMSPFIIPHLGSFADDWRAQVALIDHLRAPSQRLHRHLRRPPLRSPASRRCSAPARARSSSAAMALAAPRRRAGEDPRAGLRRRRSAGPRRQPAAPDRSGDFADARDLHHGASPRGARICSARGR